MANANLSVLFNVTFSYTFSFYRFGSIVFDDFTSHFLPRLRFAENRSKSDGFLSAFLADFHGPFFPFLRDGRERKKVSGRSVLVN